MALGKTISNLLKICLAVAALGYMVIRLWHFDQWNQVLPRLQASWSGPLILFLMASLMLAPVNLSIETIKWRMVIQHLEPLGFFRALHAILSGLSLSIMTPNRVGDIVTRSLVLNPKNRVASTGLTSVNSLAQTLVTLLFGIPAALLYAFVNTQAPQEDRQTVLLLLIISLITGSVAIWLFVRLPRLVNWLCRFRWLKRLEELVPALNGLPTQRILRVLILSGLKYLIYLTQFYLLIRFFGIEIGWLSGFAAIGTIYLFLSFVPVPSLGDVGIRGSITLFILTPFSADTPGILMASMGIWIINIVLPALIGLFLLSKIKF